MSHSSHCIELSTEFIEHSAIFIELSTNCIEVCLPFDKLRERGQAGLCGVRSFLLTRGLCLLPALRQLKLQNYTENNLGKFANVGLNLRDRFRVLTKCTPRKAFNATKVLSSYYLSKWSGKPVQWGMPVSVSIEPTTACNLGCPECPSGLKQFTNYTIAHGFNLGQSVICHPANQP